MQGCSAAVKQRVGRARALELLKPLRENLSVRSNASARQRARKCLVNCSTILYLLLCLCMSFELLSLLICVAEVVRERVTRGQRHTDTGTYPGVLEECTAAPWLKLCRSSAIQEYWRERSSYTRSFQNWPKGAERFRSEKSWQAGFSQNPISSLLGIGEVVSDHLCWF